MSSTLVELLHPACTAMVPQAFMLQPSKVDISQSQPIGPPRKIGEILIIFGFFWPMEKMAREGPKWGGDAFLRHKKPRRQFGQNGF